MNPLLFISYDSTLKESSVGRGGGHGKGEVLARAEQKEGSTVMEGHWTATSRAHAYYHMISYNISFI